MSTPTTSTCQPPGPRANTTRRCPSPRSSTTCPRSQAAAVSAGIPAQNNIHGNVQAPLLPYRLSNFVLAVLGLSNYGPYANHCDEALNSLLKPQAGSSNACLHLRPA